MVTSRKSRRWERKFGAPEIVLEADLTTFPRKWDTNGQHRLSEYAEAIIDATSDFGLSEVHIPSAWYTHRIRLSGDKARAVLLERVQRTGDEWWLGEVIWTDVERSNYLLMWADADNGDPMGIDAWGPKAQSVLGAIESAWTRLSQETVDGEPTEP